MYYSVIFVLAFIAQLNYANAQGGRGGGAGGSGDPGDTGAWEEVNLPDDDVTSLLENFLPDGLAYQVLTAERWHRGAIQHNITLSIDNQQCHLLFRDTEHHTRPIETLEDTCTEIIEDIDECESTPCQNGGSCTDGFASYTCACAAGYTGQNCEININDCLPNPCQNGGICTDGVNNYTCQCMFRFNGYNCENEDDDDQGGTEYIQHVGKHISWGQPQPSVTTKPACATLCAQDDNCTFYDWNYGYIGDTYVGPYQGVHCWLHDETKTVDDIRTAYMKVDCFEKTFI